MGFDRKQVLCAMLYALAGMGLGIYMAASQNHGQHVTHAHILLVGFITSVVYGVVYKLWLPAAKPAWAWVQFVAHQTGVLAMCSGLFLLYGGFVPAAQLEPVLGIASMAVLLGAVTMALMVYGAGHQAISTSSNGRSTAS
jgi:hypothetical protein